MRGCSSVRETIFLFVYRAARHFHPFENAVYVRLRIERKHVRGYREGVLDLCGGV